MISLADLQSESQEDFVMRLRALCADGSGLDITVLALWNTAVDACRAGWQSVDHEAKAQAARQAAIPLADVLARNADAARAASEPDGSLQSDPDDASRSFAARQIRQGRWWFEIDAYSITASPLTQIKTPANLDKNGRGFFLAERENLLRDAILPLLTALSSGSVRLSAVSPEQQQTAGKFEPIPLENLRQRKWKIGYEGDVQFEFGGNRITYANPVIYFSPGGFEGHSKHLEDKPASPSIPTRSGAPGRPTSAQIVRVELQRMLEAGETRPSQAAWARDLSDWLARACPEAPQLLVKSLGNALRRELRDAVRKLKN